MPILRDDRLDAGLDHCCSKECGLMRHQIHVLPIKRTFHRFVCSSPGNRGTLAVTGMFVARALRSLILLYIGT